MADDARPDPERVVAEHVRPVDLRDYADFDPERPKRVRVLASDVLTLDVWGLEPQQATDVLLHDEIDVIYTVLGGKGWFVTDEGEIGLGPLGAVLVPAGVAHGLDNRGVDPLIVVATSSPPDVPASELTTDAPVEERREAFFQDRPGVMRRLRGRLGS